MMSSPEQQERDKKQSASANLDLVVENESKDVDEHGNTACRHDHKPRGSIPPWLFRTRNLQRFHAYSAQPPHFPPPYRQPAVFRPSCSTAATISRVPQQLKGIVFSRESGNMLLGGYSVSNPSAVSIGPYHRFFSHHLSMDMDMDMDAAKHAAVEEFCRAASLSREQVHGKILSVAEDARKCYDFCGWYDQDVDADDEFAASFAEMLLLDGCFLLQFMVSMARRPDDDPEAWPDPFMSRADVHTRIDAIARDVLLLENQIPWFVLQSLVELLPSAEHVVDSFLALMASAFDNGNVNAINPPTTLQAQQQSGKDEPPHLLALFHRRQMGAARTRSLRVQTLSSLSSTAVELAEIGVKLVAAKTDKFGDMAMTKRRRRLGIFGELSLAPLVLAELTQCWLFNMAAYEACLGFTRADNFAVSSYIALMSLLMNRREDVQEMRAKGLVVSAFSDEDTLRFFKCLAPRLQVGHRYYDVFKHLQEYRKERWLWIAVHRFLYKNIKTIVAVLSVVGVLAGLFKTITSLKQPQR